MVRRNRKKQNQDGEDGQPEKEHRTVKLALPSIINEPFRAPLVETISQMSIKATVIAFLASMLFMYKVSIIACIVLAFDNCNQIEHHKTKPNLLMFLIIEIIHR